MTIRTRRAIFYGMFALFLLASYLLILYSQGWRINFINCSIKDILNCNIKFQKTGAIYIQTKPNDVKISINNKNFSDASGLLKSGTFIENLLPKLYEVKIEKDGYFPYIKNVVVEPAIVSAITNTILVPKKINSEVAFLLKLRGENLVDLNSGFGKFIIRSHKDEIFYEYDFNQPLSALNINTLLNNIKSNWSIKRIIIHPYDQNKLIIEANKSGIEALFILDSQKLALEQIYQDSKNEKLAGWEINNSYIYYVNESYDKTASKTEYSLNYFNLVLKNKNKIANLSNISKANKEIFSLKISNANEQAAILNKNGELFLLDIQSQKFKKIDNEVAGFSFSPDGRSLVYFKNNSKNAIVYFVKDWQKNTAKKSGEYINLKFNKDSDIENIFWHKDSLHIFIKYKDLIVFSEVDDRYPINNYPITDSAIDNFFYDLSPDAAYFIKNQNLYSIEFKKVY